MWFYSAPDDLKPVGPKVAFLGGGDSVTVASTYTKRANVLRVKTRNHGEFLFQTRDAAQLYVAKELLSLPVAAVLDQTHYIRSESRQASERITSFQGSQQCSIPEGKG